MKHYKIPTDVRLDIERIVGRYPRNKNQLETLYSDIVLSHPSEDSIKGNISSENKPQSVTEAKALRLMNPYYERLRRETYAVDQAIKDLDSIDLEIIRRRYWQGKKVPYEYIDLPYSVITMKRHTYKVLRSVGLSIGLIKE